MEAIAVRRKIEESDVAAAIRDVAAHLDSADRELVLDFSSVGRIDPDAVCALDDLARRSNDKSIKVTLHGVNLDVYKALKLVNLTSRFSFVN